MADPIDLAGRILKLRALLSSGIRPEWRGREGDYAYARWHDAEGKMQSGWVIVDDLGHHHGRWSCLAYRPCGCPPVRPC